MMEAVIMVYRDACVRFRDASDSDEKAKFSALCTALEAVYPTETEAIRWASPDKR